MTSDVGALPRPFLVERQLMRAIARRTTIFENLLG